MEKKAESLQEQALDYKVADESATINRLISLSADFARELTRELGRPVFLDKAEYTYSADKKERPELLLKFKV